MNKPRIGTKRALSTPVTSALLISAVAVMGVTLVGWSQSTLSNNQVLLSNQFSDQINTLNEYAIIENVWFGSSNLMNYTITNVGTVYLNVTEIKLTDTSKNTLHTITISDGGILPNQFYPKEDTGYSWSSGETLNVVVTTARDKIYTTQVVAP